MGSSRASGSSLERKLPLLICGLLLLVVVVYCWAAFREERASSVQAATDHLRMVSQQLAELSRAGTAQRVATVGRLATEDAVGRVAAEGPPADATTVGATPSASAGAATALLAAAVPAADSLHVAWEVWSADGARRLTVGDSASTFDAAQLREAFRQVSHTGVVGHSPLYAVGSHVFSWFVVPVRVGGRPAGYLAERRRVANSERGERAIRDLSGQDVTLLFTSRGTGLWTTMRGVPVPPPFDRASAPGPFQVEGATGRLFGVQTNVDGTPYSVVLTLPESTVLRRPLTFLRRMLTIGVILLTLGALGAWLLSRHVTRPIRTMTDAAEALAGGDYRQRVSVKRRDELGRLATTFNAMAQRIGASHTELAMRVQQSSAMAAELERRNEELRAAQEETLRAVRRTERLQEVAAALAGALDFDHVAAVVVREGLQAAAATAGSIFLVGTEGTALDLVRAEGHRGVEMSGWSTLPADAAIPVAEAVRESQAVYVESPDGWHERYGLAAPLPPAGRAWAGLPLVARGRIIGAMGFSFSAPRTFDRETRAFLLALTQQCAQALDRAMLFDAALHARHAAEEAGRAAQEANAAKSSFLAMMSHELRTPLNAIGGYAELIEMGIRGPVTDQQRDDLGRIKRSQKHLLSIINDILSHARIEAGQLTVRDGDVALDDVLTNLDALIAPQVAEKGVHYEATGAEGVAVRADREKLQQVLLNLVSNAVRFTDVGGAVGVTCVSTGDLVRVRVADTGIGIPSDKLDAIFEPFVQVDAGLTRRTGGTGLGLAISRDLMAAMGGRITVSSEPGRGSAFTIELPRGTHRLTTV